MDIQADRMTYTNAESVVRTGNTTFEEPYVRLAIQDSLSEGAAGFTSLLVDIVPYTKATVLAAGRSEEEADAEARARYMEALHSHDVDGFEAEMFWDTYVDVEWTKQNPYAVKTDNPYLTDSAPEASSEDVGWGPRSTNRTLG